MSASADSASVLLESVAGVVAVVGGGGEGEEVRCGFVDVVARAVDTHVWSLSEFLITYFQFAFDSM